MEKMQKYQFKKFVNGLQFTQKMSKGLYETEIIDEFGTQSSC